MEANKQNLNIRALPNDEAFNSFILYFKSILNYRPLNKINEIKQSHNYKINSAKNNFYYFNNNNNNNNNKNDNYIKQ